MRAFFIPVLKYYPHDCNFLTVLRYTPYMKFNFSLLFLLLISMSIAAQNLVPDSSFEAVVRLPAKKNNAVSCTRHWSCPMDYGAGDYYHKNGKGHGRAPRNIFGRQQPHSGDAYGGMCIRKKFIEYLDTKLTDTLIRNQEYLVEFYISRAERSFGAVKELGVLFTDKISMGISGIGIPVKPSVEMINTHGFRKKNKWMKFSAVYKAKGGEAALILGYFNYNNEKRFNGNAHYYVDDVSVTLINKKTGSATSVSFDAEESIPKPVLPTFDEAIILDDIFFASNKSELLPASFSALDKLVGNMKKYAGSSIEISGYTDNTGEEDQNLLLSELRAKAVAYYLISKGIQPSRITYTGYGNSKPIANNNTDEGKQKNRRVEFILKNK